MYEIFLEILIAVLLAGLFFCFWLLRKKPSGESAAPSEFAGMRGGEEEIRKLLHVIEQYPVSVVISDREGNIEYVNPQFYELTGYAAHEIMGKHLEFLVKGCDDESPFDEMWASITSGDKWKGEFCKEDGGKKCWGLMSIAPVRNIDGQINNYITIMENITDRKEMLEEINRNHKIQVVLNKILNILLEPIPLHAQLRQSLAIVMDGPFERLGKSASIMLADNEKSELRMTAHVAMPESIVEKCNIVPFGTCICGKVAQITEIEHIDCTSNMEKMNVPDHLPEGLYCVPVRSNNRLLAVMSIHMAKGRESDEKEMDFLRLVATTLAGVIEKKLGEEELQIARAEAVFASQAKSDFLANMSHEFRTPLNAVIGFSEMMILGIGGALNEKQTEFAKDIHESGEHLLALINDILDLSKVESGILELDCSYVSIQDLVKKSFLFVRQRCEDKGLALSCEIEEGIEKICCDEMRIKQVLVNLLSNAVKFTNEGSIIVRVSLKEGGRILQVLVEDTGIGIKAEDLLMLFQPFRQVETGYARDNEGSGLGLALCKNIINSHKGVLWAESTFGEGSRFIFTLPFRHQGLDDDKCISLVEKK